MKVRYAGESFYSGLGLTNGKVYVVLDKKEPFYRIIDDSGEDYLYSKTNPAPLDGSSKGGYWNIVEY
ncbi:hypothetical protein [Lactobacillus gasseri]|jgi:hypothetical protein|uniref:hypothetical protein n=1 Tax=Lactobacillus gasseri TaxID=1596 RepID=UPI0006650D0C|nr:hypothetical protein [Lactobacillus gasseri]